MLDRHFFAFHGDVYLGLEPLTLDERSLTSAQRRLRILSGLYGMLKPLDLIHPYRLEMGLDVENERGPDLYAYWTNHITEEIEHELANHRNPILVNLASEQYFKVVNVTALFTPGCQL